MTPLTTMGVASAFTVVRLLRLVHRRARGLRRFLRGSRSGNSLRGRIVNRYDQATLRFETFDVVTCVSGENRVPPRSRLYIGQSAVESDLGVCASAGSNMISASNKA